MDNTHDFKSISEAWESYLQHCVPPEAGREQISGSMAAFHAGAIVAVNLVLKTATDLDELNEIVDQIKKGSRIATEMMG
jgi:hypothetical protein